MEFIKMEDNEKQKKDKDVEKAVRKKTVVTYLPLWAHQALKIQSVNDYSTIPGTVERIITNWVRFKYPNLEKEFKKKFGDH